MCVCVCVCVKATGNELFKARRFNDAVAAYTAAIACVTAALGEGVMGTPGEQRARRRLEGTVAKLRQDEATFRTKIEGQLQQVRHPTQHLSNPSPSVVSVRPL